MSSKEIFNIKNKNSQEILLYLQRKSIFKKNPYFKDFQQKLENKIQIIENNEINENIPPTRMKQFINNSIIPTNSKQKLSSSKISKNQKEISIMNCTPKFNQADSLKTIDTNKNVINENNSIFSFSEKEDINNNSVNYLNFHLHENIERSKCKKDDICHLYLPKKYKDDEQYKSNLYKYLKIKNYKNNIMFNKGIKTQILEPKINFPKFPGISKKKKIYSVKKKTTNKMIFFSNNIESIFNLYKDDDIGIDKRWQLPIVYQNYDNDIDSDDEQINKGQAKMMYDLKLAIIKWSQNKNICYNKRYVDAPIFTGNVKKYSISV